MSDERQAENAALLHRFQLCRALNKVLTFAKQEIMSRSKKKISWNLKKGIKRTTTRFFIRIFLVYQAQPPRQKILRLRRNMLIKFVSKKS